MKKIFSIISALLLSAVILISCKKDGVTYTATSGTSGTLTASASLLELTSDVASDTVLSFNWTAASFGYPAAVTQVLQFAVSGTSFASVATLAVDNGVIYQGLTGAGLNKIASSLGLSYDSSTTLDVRLVSSISDSLSSSYTNTVTVKVKPYLSTSWIYVPGAYESWDIASADSLVSLTGNNIYTGIIDFDAASSQFKLTTAKNWNVNYGSSDNATLVLNGSNMKSPGAGSYQITADLNALTIELTKMQWGVIGDATPGGWSADTDMKYNNGDSTWSVTTALTAGTFKFRLNGAWSKNYGGSSGTLVSGGDNITISTAGTYKVVMDIPNSKYTLTKQ